MRDEHDARGLETPESGVSFVWFWTFWHWSKESYRAGALLDGPVHGMAGHWDEWYTHEATDAERRAIEDAGHSIDAQRRFISWLVRRWAADARWRDERPPARFVLGQLAGLAPFDGWSTFARYRSAWHVPGVSAVVLAEESAGAPADVRKVEALCIPADPGVVAPSVVAEGFSVDVSELRAMRAAVDGLLGGRSLALLVATWLAAGRRPYPRPLGALLALGWLVVAALVAWLMVGPDPGSRLRAVATTLALLWGALLATATGMAAVLATQAWQQGRAWRALLARSELRLRMEGGLTLIGGSAGLPFALNALLGVARAGPRVRVRSWLWRRVAQSLRANAPTWAATGVIAADGAVRPVVLAPKLRAALQHPGIRDLLAPWQRDAHRRAVAPIAEALATSATSAPRVSPLPPHVRVGFASERHALRGHRCRSLAHAVMSIGGLWSGRQVALNVVALAASVIVALALPDLRAMLVPASSPAVVGPTSSSPYHLWVSLDTPHPDDFAVVLESDFWANRRVRVASYGGPTPSVRAEIPLLRRRARLPPDAEDGTVWVERRHSFLFREFAPGERVGQYSLSWVSRLDD